MGLKIDMSVVCAALLAFCGLASCKRPVWEVKELAARISDVEQELYDLSSTSGLERPDADVDTCVAPSPTCEGVKDHDNCQKYYRLKDEHGFSTSNNKAGAIKCVSSRLGGCTGSSVDWKLIPVYTQCPAGTNGGNAWSDLLGNLQLSDPVAAPDQGLPVDPNRPDNIGDDPPIVDFTLKVAGSTPAAGSIPAEYATWIENAHKNSYSEAAFGDAKALQVVVNEAYANIELKLRGAGLSPKPLGVSGGSASILIFKDEGTQQTLVAKADSAGDAARDAAGVTRDAAGSLVTDVSEILYRQGGGAPSLGVMLGEIFLSQKAFGGTTAPELYNPFWIFPRSNVQKGEDGELLKGEGGQLQLQPQSALTLRQPWGASAIFLERFTGALDSGLTTYNGVKNDQKESSNKDAMQELLKRFPEEGDNSVVNQFTARVEELAAKGFAHTDMKAPNVVVREKDGSFELKMIDLDPEFMKYVPDLVDTVCLKLVTAIVMEGHFLAWHHASLLKEYIGNLAAELPDTGPCSKARFKYEYNSGNTWAVKNLGGKDKTFFQGAASMFLQYFNKNKVSKQLRKDQKCEGKEHPFESMQCVRDNLGEADATKGGTGPRQVLPFGPFPAAEKEE